VIRRLLSLDTVWWALPLSFAVLWCFLTPVEPADFWYQAALGRRVAAERAVPAADQASFSQAGEAFRYQSWLAGLALDQLLESGGVPLVVLANAALMALAAALLLLAAARRCGSLPLASVLVFVTVPLVGNNWNVRAQSFAIPLFCGFLLVIERLRAGGRGPVWVLPLLMAVWVNVHGSFVLGLVLLATVLVAEAPWRPARLEALLPGALGGPAWRRLAIATAATALATLLNPAGPRVFAYVGELSANPLVTGRMVEWQPLDLGTPFGAAVLAYVLAVAGSLAFVVRRPRAGDLALFVGFAWLGFSMVRAVIWLVYVSLPVLASALTRFAPRRERPDAGGPPALNATLLGLLAGGLILCSPWVKPSLPLDERMRPLVARGTPVAAVEHIRAEPDRPARMFHTMEYGGYLMWALPELPVFVDPRIEFYSPAIWSDYLSIVDDRDALAIIDRWGFDGLLLSKTEQPALIRTLLESGRWSVRYEDAEAVYFRPAG